MRFLPFPNPRPRAEVWRSLATLALVFLAAGPLLAGHPAAAKAPAWSAHDFFASRCALCHGDQGRAEHPASSIGTIFHAANLRSPQVQALTDSAMEQIITNGKGNMLAFKQTLTPAQIHAMVLYIRQLAKTAIKPQLHRARLRR